MAEVLNTSSEQNRTALMRKHVNAVALLPIIGGRRISLFERRLYNLLLMRSQKMGDLEEYEARFSDLVKETASNSNNTKPLKAALVGLLSTTVQWQSPTGGEIERWDACNLLSHAGITKESNSLTVRWGFSSKIRSQLIYPERYAGISIGEMVQLSSHASLALYEICVRYVDNPRGLTSRQHWHWWKPVLTGAPTEPNKMGEYRFFKRDVLAKAIADINSHTSLTVEGPIEHRGRDNKTIEEIQFRVTRKSRATPLVSTKSMGTIKESDLPTIGRSITLGVDQESAEDLVIRFGADVVSAWLDKLADRKQMPPEKIQPIRSEASWLKFMIEKSLEKSEIKREPAIPAGSKATVEKQRAVWTDAWLRQRKDELRTLFTEQPEAEQSECLHSFRQFLVEGKKQTILTRFDADGPHHKMVRETFVRFLGEQAYGENWDKPTSEDLLTVAATAQIVET